MSFNTNIDSIDSIINKCVDVSKWFNTNAVGLCTDRYTVASIDPYIHNEKFYIEFVSTTGVRFVGYYIDLSTLIRVVDLKILNNSIYVLCTHDNHDSEISTFNRYYPSGHREYEVYSISIN